MTKRDLAALLVIHADRLERIGQKHPALMLEGAVNDLREAAEVLRHDATTTVEQVKK